MNNSSKLPDLECEQIVSYEKVHIEQQGGPLSSTGYQIRFKRDKNGKMCTDGTGSYAPDKTKSTYKYTT